jgi:hypothetical protein
MTLEQIFSIVDSISPNENGCKIWPLSLAGSGLYACAVIPDGGTSRVHRRVLVRKLGREILSGYCACHTCDTPACVNEDHLWEGTNADNTTDAKAKHRLASGRNHGMFGKGYLRLGENHPFYGKKHKDSTKELISISRKGKPAHPNWRVGLAQYLLQRRTTYWGA